MNVQIETKAVVTVAEMARMCGLSRARFYQLMGTVFPEPSRDPETKRPFYTEEQQQVCLEVRRRNCGVNGQPVLFYARGNSPITSTPKRKKKPQQQNKYADLIEAWKSLGLSNVTTEQVAAATVELYPNLQASELVEGEVVRQVFIHIQRQNTSDNVR